MSVGITAISRIQISLVGKLSQKPLMQELTAKGENEGFSFTVITQKHCDCTQTAEMEIKKYQDTSYQKMDKAERQNFF